MFQTQNEWIDWLAKHHDDPGVWVKIAKKASGIASVTYDQAVEGALCFGWIDGISKSIDDQFYRQKFTPRRKGSVWSKVNVEKAERLIKSGRMQPGGTVAVEAAKADGRWDQAYDSSRTMQMPDDFADALRANPAAKAFYETLSKTNTYSILWRIQTAKKPETRQARIEKFITMLEEGKTLH